MTKSSRRFDNRLERLRRLMLGLSVALFSVQVLAQGSSTNRNAQQPTTALPAQLSPQNASSRRIHAVRVTEAIKVDGALNEPSWSQAEPATDFRQRSEEHTSELQSRSDLVCRLLLEKKKTRTSTSPCTRPSTRRSSPPRRLLARSAARTSSPVSCPRRSQRQPSTITTRSRKTSFWRY